MNPDDSTLDDPTLEERLRLLESSSEIQEQILANLQAERIESDRLSLSVGRLGDGATTLGEALLRVDRNQQQLTKLGRQLSEVEQATDRKADRAEVTATADHLTLQRRQLALRFIFAGLVSAAILGSLLAFTISADYFACQQRQERVTIQVNSFRQIAGLAEGQVRDRINELAQQLDETKVNCDSLYPVHFGDEPPW